jgi:hypothetical protein
VRELARQIIADFPYKRPMLGLDGGELLMECVAGAEGDYIEIGSAYGGSAIMAAMAMESVGRDGTVFCVDPFSAVNRLEGPDMSLNLFWANVSHFGVQQRIIAFKQHHPPFPDAIHYHGFSVGLIDGNHRPPYPAQDFSALKDRVTEFLLMDNAEKEPVADVIRKAEDWEEHMAVRYESTLGEKMVDFVALRRRNL